MYREVLRGLLIACILLSPWSGTGAQPARPAAEAPEIKLDEQTTLKATALEARMAAVVANLAWSQPEKVGIVTTLVGNVTARRVILPESVPLKFKDDVFYEDTITTGDQSLARVLLGGKSIVTIRERSVLTITESPGRSFVNLESGKIGLAVARDRLAPGESVDIRTPNAVIGVRGTV